MGTVIVLGAGASVCEALHRRAKWEKDRPPLDADFFQRAANANRDPSLIRRIEMHADAAGLPNPFTRPTPVSLERYLGLLYASLLRSPTADDKVAYFALLRLYNRELSATTNWIIGRKRGPIETLVRIELARQPSILTIITFNHDLLAENALANLPPRRFGRRWCLEHGYGFSKAGVKYASMQGSTDVWPPCAGHHEGEVRVLKMHGSLNWVFATRDLNPSLNLATQKKSIYVLNARRPRAGGRIRLGRARRLFPTWPVVVPPLFEKLTFIQHHLNEVWSAAEEALTEAERVVFFGYSFPAADHHSRFFFERLSARNEALRWPTIINPDYEVVKTCGNVLASSGVRAYRSFQDFESVEAPIPNP